MKEKYQKQEKVIYQTGVKFWCHLVGTILFIIVILEQAEKYESCKNGSKAMILASSVHSFSLPLLKTFLLIYTIFNYN